MDLGTRIKTYVPKDEKEATDRTSALYALQFFDDLLWRTNPVIHCTASAFVLNPEKNKMLFVYHRIYDSWSWVGGHADGEEDLREVALRELREETGLERILNCPEEPLSMEILTVEPHVKKGKRISAHLHLNFTWHVIAEEKEPVSPRIDENVAVAWIPVDELKRRVTEEKMLPLYRKLLRRLRE